MSLSDLGLSRGFQVREETGLGLMQSLGEDRLAFWKTLGLVEGKTRG